MQQEKILSKKKASFINLLFNYSNAIFGIISGLVLMPLYLKYFSIGTYGSYLASGSIISLLGLLDGGMSLVLTQKLSSAYSRKNHVEFTDLLGSGLFISILTILVLSVAGVILSFFIPNWVKAETLEYSNIQIAFILSAIGAGLGIFFHNISSVFQALLKVTTSGYANLISIFFGIASTLLGLHIGFGVISIPFGILIRNFVAIVILLFSLIVVLKRTNMPSLTIKERECKILLLSILPMFVGNVSKTLVSNSQLLIITTFVNPVASAVFFITGRIYIVCDTFLAPIGTSIFSSIAQIYSQSDIETSKKSIIKVFNLFSLFSAILLSASLVMNESFITLFLGKDKYGGILLSIFLCLNMLLNTRFNFIIANLFAIGVFGKTILFDILSGIVRLIIIFLAIKKIGYISIPIAEFFATIVIMGYYLNKLICDKLEINEFKQRVRFIFLGTEYYLFASIISMLWLYSLPGSENWIKFTLQFLGFTIVLVSLFLLFFKKVQNYFVWFKSSIIKRTY